MREYDRIASWYAAARNPAVGLAEVDALMRLLPPGASVLDIGCGDGVPITRRLTEAGFRVRGLDSSAAMVARFRATLPGVPVRHSRVEEVRLPPDSLDAVVAWGVLFHLVADAQRAVFASIGTWLRPGGQLLFTSGDAAGEVDGVMEDVAFRYVSLSADDYRNVLAAAGLVPGPVCRDAWDNVVYTARKVG